MAELFKNIGDVAFDGLIAGDHPVHHRNVTLSAGAVMKAGTLLTLGGTSGKYAATAKGNVASAILAHDTTAADTVVNVYTSGMFIIEKLIAASGDTVVAHQIELEDAGIYMQHAM